MDFADQVVDLLSEHGRPVIDDIGVSVVSRPSIWHSLFAHLTLGVLVTRSVMAEGHSASYAVLDGLLLFQIGFSASLRTRLFWRLQRIIGIADRPAWIADDYRSYDPTIVHINL